MNPVDETNLAGETKIDGKKVVEMNIVGEKKVDAKNTIDGRIIQIPAARMRHPRASRRADLRYPHPLRRRRRSRRLYYHPYYRRRCRPLSKPS